MTYDDRPRQLTSLTTYLLSQVAKIAKRDLDARLAEGGMRMRHMAVLAAVEENASSQLDLARSLNLDPSDVTSTVDDLETRRFVTRRVDRADRRRKLVSITAAGRRELSRLHAVAEQLADSLLEPMPERRRRQLHADLSRVLARHDARNGVDTGDAGTGRTP